MMTILAAKKPQTGKVQPGEGKSCQGDDEDEATAQETKESNKTKSAETLHTSQI